MDIPRPNEPNARSSQPSFVKQYSIISVHPCFRIPILVKPLVAAELFWFQIQFFMVKSSHVSSEKTSSVDVT